MATVFKKRSKENLPAKKAEKPPRSGHKGRWLLLLALLGGGLWFSPAIASRTSLGDWPLRQALNGIDGTISSGSRTFGWLSSIVYHDVQIRDAKGNVLATIATIRTDQTLSNWPHIQSSGHDPNRATAGLRRRSARRQQSRGRAPALVDQRADGQAGFGSGIDRWSHRYARRAADQQWKIDSISTTLRIGPASSWPVELRSAGAVQTDRGPEKFKLAYLADGGALLLSNIAAGSVAAGSATASGGTANGGDREPALSRPPPRRPRAADVAGAKGRVASRSAAVGDVPAVVGPCRARGPVGGPTFREIAIPARHGRRGQSSGRQIQADDFTLTATPLGADQVHFATLNMPCKLSWKPSQLDVEQLGVTCDVADIELTGQIALPLKANMSPADLLNQTYTVQGQLDLAKLAKLLPATLHVPRRHASHRRPGETGDRQHHGGNRTR